MRKYWIGILLSAFWATLAETPWGVASHPLWSKAPSDLEMEIRRCCEAGFQMMRTDISYGSAMREGEGALARQDELVRRLGERGIALLAVLEGYDNEIPPALRPLHRHPEAWRKYVRKVARHFRGRIRHYEIWNEQDGGFWKPHPDAAQYVPLLKIAYEEIKAADPEAVVVAGGLCYWNASYLSEMYRAGAKGYFDVAAVHPYGYAPESNSRTARQMAAFLQVLADNGEPDKPIWITECGGSSYSSALETQQPDLLIRAVAAAFRQLGGSMPERLKIGLPVNLETPEDTAPPRRRDLPGAELFYYTPESLAKLDPAEFPVVVGCDGLSVYEDYLEPLQEYVSRGGIMIATSKMVPFYVRRHRKPDGSWSERDDADCLQKMFRLGYEAHWTKAGLPQSTFGVRTTEAGRASGIGELKNIYSSRWMSPKNIKAGDSWIPLVRALDGAGRNCGDALVLCTFGDWKGAVIANTMLLAGEYSEDEQANLIIRVYLDYLARGVKKIFVYNLRCKGINPADREDNFGIIRRDFSLKPAHSAIARMTRILGAEPCFEQSLLPDSRVRALLFRRGEDGKRVLAVWGTEETVWYRVGTREFHGCRIRYFENVETLPETLLLRAEKAEETESSGR